MAKQEVQEETANPYNAKKAWHKRDEKDFISSDSLFFPEEETQETQKASEKKTKQTKKAKTPDYKKRYDDLKSHYDSKLDEFKTREKELLEEAAKNRPNYTAPKSPEELEKFREQYPDVYEVVETVAHMQSSEKTKTLEEQLASLQERETELIAKQAQERLMNNHPDFDGDLASRALDLYKRDMNLDSSKTKKPSSTRKSKTSAADMVSTKTTAVEPKQAKIWTEKEIAAMSMDEFDQYEEEIGKAISEGRVVQS